jgi:hypothetical protein
MFLITNDGKSYKAYDKVYCGQAYDFLAYARVVPPDPPIQISKESDLVLTTNNTVGQPKAMHFIFQSYGESINAADFDPPKRDNGKYYIPTSFASGNYVLNVLADWEVKNQDLSASFHRFKVVINKYHL